MGDFTIGAQPPSVTIHKGGTATYTVSVGALNGFKGTVTFSITGKPTWAKATFNPASVTGSGTSTLTVKTNPFLTATKTFHMTIKGTSGTVIHSTMVDMVVTP